jgi:TonB family protein
MTRLRLFDSGSAVDAEGAASLLFGTPPNTVPYRRRGWPYATSMIVHAIVTTSLVILVRHFTQPPPSPPLPPPQENRTVAHAFVYSGFRVDHRRPRGVRKTQHSANALVVAAGDTAPAPLPPARDESRVPETSAIVEDTPVRTVFDPPIPAGNARMTGRHGDPRETDFGTASASVRASPAAEIRSGGFGDGSALGVRTGSSLSQGRAGLDGPGEGDGAIPPRIQEPLPIPEYPPEARTRRLQGVVVLDVMLDARGKPHVRGVLSDRLGFGIEEAAANAAERLKFIPARQSGRSVDAIVQVRVTFTLTGVVATVVTGGA